MTDALKTSLGALGTIAFALPGPWGPVVSAALHVAESIFDPDASTDHDKIVIDQIKASATEIEDFYSLALVKKANANIAAIKNWLATIDGMSDLDTNPKSVQLALDGLDDLKAPWSNITQWISDLEAISSKDDDRKLADLEKARISGIVQLYMIMTMLLNYRVIMQNKLVLMDQDSDDTARNAKVRDGLETLESYYDFLVSYITQQFSGSVQSDISRHIGSAQGTLISRIGGIESKGHHCSILWPHSAITYYVEDKSNPPTRIVSETNTYDCSANNKLGILSCSTREDKKTKAAADRAMYIVNLTSDWGSFHVECVDVITKAAGLFKNSPGEPTPPQKAPDVDVSTATPWPHAWRFPGKYVRYSVGFQSARRSTKLAGPWSDWQQVGGTGEICPIVSLPDDTSGLAMARIVYCQISDTPSSGSNTLDLVTPVPNLSQTHIVDLKPTNATEVCPNALVAPLMTYSSFNADDPKRTWPGNYRVRYAFKYTLTDKAGTVTESPDWSPWAAPANAAEYDVDSGGYAHRTGPYYSPQMVVPRKPGFGYKLLRQFKIGSKEEAAGEIKTNVVQAKNARMIFVEDGTGP